LSATLLLKKVRTHAFALPFGARGQWGENRARIEKSCRGRKGEKNEKKKMAGESGKSTAEELGRQEGLSPAPEELSFEGGEGGVADA